MNIEITGLSKIYPNGHAAILNVNLEIGSGMFGLLGPNGAGKSTFMRVLVALQKATSGTILIDGMDINKHRHKIRPFIGYLPQDFTFFSKLKTRKNKVLDRRKALNSIWGENDFFNRKSMDVFIHKLRKYLDKDPSIRITNVHGKGFVLED